MILQDQYTKSQELATFRALSFDCYGTLIDWETGLLRAFEPLLRLQAFDARGSEEMLRLFAEEETKQEAKTPSMPYPSILDLVHQRVAARLNLDPPPELHRAFARSVGQWPAFADSAASLAYLKRHFRLIVLSNVDVASFRASNKRLEVEFDAVYTAEEIGSYKPDPRNFEWLVSRVREDLDVEPGELLHVAQSLYHDHVPAKAIGLSTAWIDRRSGRLGWGATLPLSEHPNPDFTFSSLEELVRTHQHGVTERGLRGD